MLYSVDPYTKYKDNDWTFSVEYNPNNSALTGCTTDIEIIDNFKKFEIHLTDNYVEPIGAGKCLQQIHVNHSEEDLFKLSEFTIKDMDKYGKIQKTIWCSVITDDVYNESETVVCGRIKELRINFLGNF